jgi:hypothetical protein
VNRGYDSDATLEDFINKVSSIEFIKTNDTKLVVYYHLDFNNENYQSKIDKTIFRVENWEEISKYKLIHHIK